MQEVRKRTRKKVQEGVELSQYVPGNLGDLSDPQRAIPRIAKDGALTREIENCLRTIPTHHVIRNGDARKMRLSPNSVHLVLTSPPYWTLKEYNRVPGQLGFMNDYDDFLNALDEVWSNCFEALAPGGRLICVVGDVCLSRRKNGGRHMVVPLHAAIQMRCADIGFDNLSPIIWNKIANAQLEANGNGGSFLGKPYEPNAVVKNDIEFILMERKPGGYRSPDFATRILSVVPEQKHREWFQQIWTGLPGASTRNHPAPFPLELAARLIRMFSFAGDTILDPFLGTGTTTIAAAQFGRNSIGYEVDNAYHAYACQRFRESECNLFATATFKVR